MSNLIEEDLAYLSEEFEEVQMVVENLENLAKKNNLEQPEGVDLGLVSKDLFMS